MTFFRLLLLWALGTAILFSLPKVVPGLHISGWTAAAIYALVIGALNMAATPLLALLIGVHHLALVVVAVFFANAAFLAAIDLGGVGYRADSHTATTLAAVILTAAMMVGHFIVDSREA